VRERSYKYVIVTLSVEVACLAASHQGGASGFHMLSPGSLLLSEE
jgi:hypothetical protein